MLVLFRHKIKRRGDEFDMKRDLRVKYLILFIILASVAFLSGCKIHFSTEVYVSDLLALKNGEEDIIYIPSTLKLQVISEESYLESKDKITRILKKYFGELDRVSYESNNFESFYVAQLEVIAREGSGKGTPVEGGLFSFRVREDNKNIVLAVRFNNRLFKQLENEFFKEFSQTVDTKELHLSITMINDLRNDVKLVAQGVYMGGYPCPFGASYTLKRREKIDIVFSDVLRDYLVNSEDVEFANIILE